MAVRVCLGNGFSIWSVFPGFELWSDPGPGTDLAGCHNLTAPCDHSISEPALKRLDPEQLTEHDSHFPATEEQVAGNQAFEAIGSHGKL